MLFYINTKRVFQRGPYPLRAILDRMRVYFSLGF